jgi:hypothetical protein
MQVIQYCWVRLRDLVSLRKEGIQYGAKGGGSGGIVGAGVHPSCLSWCFGPPSIPPGQS